MVAIVLLHMVQVVLFGAYKYPRELTWLVGVFLLLMTLGMAFTGQILRWDQDAYWGLGIGASVAGRVPVVGLQLVQILLGGPIIAGETLTRFFALHVFVIPGVLIGLVGVHLLMVINLGVNEWPMPGRVVKRETYIKEYQELVHKDGLPFVPVAFQKDVVFAGLIVLAVIACSAWFGPFGPTGAPDPTIIETVPRPDFFFLWMFAALALMPPHLETFALLVGPVIGILALLALPFLAGEGEKSWRRRPVAVFTILIVGVAVARLHPPGHERPVLTRHGGLERSASARPVPQGTDRAGATGRGRVPGQAVQELPWAWTRRRRSWAGARRCGGQAHAGSVDSAGDPGRRQHAGVRQEPQSRGGHGARHVPRDAASGEHRSGAHGRNRRSRRPHRAPARNLHRQIRGPALVLLAVLASWHIDVLPTTVLVLTGIIYFRGWRRLRHLHETLLPRWRLVCFTAGLTSLWLAAASPLDTLSGLFLTAHMTQHLVLMSVAPPLILLGAPIVPLLRGLPRRSFATRLGPFLAWPPLRRFAHRLTHPAVGLSVMAVAMWGWHVPGPYQLALREPFWHDVEHVTFFASSLLFWWSVVRPWPFTPHWPAWSIPPTLLLADIQNTVIAATLTFSGGSSIRSTIRFRASGVSRRSTIRSWPAS